MSKAGWLGWTVFCLGMCLYNVFSGLWVWLPFSGAWAVYYGYKFWRES